MLLRCCMRPFLENNLHSRAKLASKNFNFQFHSISSSTTFTSPTKYFWNLLTRNGKLIFINPGKFKLLKAAQPIIKPILRPLVYGSLYGIPLAVLWGKQACCKQPESSVPSSRLLSGTNNRHFGSNRYMTLEDLWILIKPYLGWLIAAIISAFAAAALNIQIPILLGGMVNYIAEIRISKDISELPKIAFPIIACYAGQAFVTFLYITFLTVLGERVSRDLRCRLFSSLLRQDMSFFDMHRSGEMVARITADVQEFKSAFKICVSQGLRSVAQLCGCVVSLYFISPKMTLLAVSALPVMVAFGAVLGGILRALSRTIQAKAAATAGYAEEALSNIRTVKAFAMEEAEERTFWSETEGLRQLSEYLGVGIGLFQGLTNFALNGIVLGVLYVGTGMISTEEMSPGDLMSFLVTAQTIQKSLGQISLLFGQAIRGWTAGGRVFEFIRLEPSIPTKGGVTIPYHSLSGHICYSGVNFYYPSRPKHWVLKELNLDLPAGKVIALCGPSGGGKSTIVSLLERFYDVEGGKITIDGQDIRSLDPQWLRGRAIGFIAQEPVLFATTIKENVRYGWPKATEEQIYQAAKLANADEFIRSFPKGYNTVLGERGVTLSGGQRQRIAIARALLKNPSILILDEATSALDAESEKLVQQALDNAAKGRTVLIIAHRLSTIQHADAIAVISDGQVAEYGTHQELLRKKGIYAKLIRHQQASHEKVDKISDQLFS